MNKRNHTIRPACFISRLTFIIFLIVLANHTMAMPDPPPQDSLSRILTVAKVYAEKDSDPGCTQVTFYESARFYKILQSNPQYAAYIRLLKEAEKKQQPLCIRFTERGGAIIDSVSKIKKPKPGS